ncbi:hypothetical protein AMJ47_01915 [Parcubacteria bacterium DG_72]|nr:MAG: hypothetical protein AMJ47_01915 [Parcubacteria bacterium DG_72]
MIKIKRSKIKLIVFFFTFNKNKGIRPIKKSAAPTDKIIKFIPKEGIKTNPVIKLPKILPKVDQKKTFPDTLPMPSEENSILCSLIAKGERVPNKNEGKKKIITAETNGPSIIEN